MLPQHIAIIMDGNGRWARQRRLPRIAGHRKGVEAVRLALRFCLRKKIKILTLFAFSSENWQRPATEVKLLMSLLMRLLRNSSAELHRQGICLRVLGNQSCLPEPLQRAIVGAERLTASNTALYLNLAINYGGRWDLVQAVQAIAREVQLNNLNDQQITESLLASYLALSGRDPTGAPREAFPDPDLLIRTGGELRLSNFLLWHLAYTELFFSECLWPEFSEAHFEQALTAFAARDRRFGLLAQDRHRQEQVQHA